MAELEQNEVTNPRSPAASDRLTKEAVAAAVEAMTGVPVRAIIPARELDRHLAQEERSKARSAAVKTPTHAHVERMNAAAQRQAANSEALER